MSSLGFPGLPLIVGGLLLPLVPRRARALVAVLLPLVGLYHLWTLPDGLVESIHVLGRELELVRVDRLSRLFGTIFHIAAFLSVIFMVHVRSALEHAATQVYAGAAIAAAFVGDLVSLFVFWELTALSSVFLIWARGTPRAYRTGMRYLIIQIASGVLLLAGAIIRYADTGSIAFSSMSANALGPALILAAFGIKAAFPLLHNWLQDAYPESTVTGTVVLSAFTTKLAIYALARGFPGTDVLIPIGAAMTAFPIFYAVIENDLRRVLAYSLNNQLGFMVVGIGIGTPLALNGTAAHAFAHILYKGLLFMSMGAVLHRTGTIKGSELGGLYKSMPWTTAFCIVGAASISAFPLFSGFVTKSMILSAAADQQHTVTFLVLLFASAGVFHHSGIKIPFFAFFAHDSGKRPKEAPWNMLLAMAGASILCVGIGIWPDPLYEILPFPVDYVPYTTTHVVTTLQLLCFSALAFAFLQRTRLYPPELPSVNLDTDWLYRRALPTAGRVVARSVSATLVLAARIAQRLLARATAWMTRHAEPPRGAFGEPWTAGTTALWAAIMLGVCVIAFLL
jgi:multicomponent Na+:H+ antiporter subunit D